MSPSTGRFIGKSVLLTGSTGGIGQAIASRFVLEGARVALVDRDRDGLRSQVDALGAACLAIECDVSVDSDVESAFGQARRWAGDIDVAVLNAGIEGRIADLHELTADDYDRVMGVNARGVFLWLSRLMGAMRARKAGAITIISSSGGLRGSVGLGPYVASKHAVVGLMKSAALEGAPEGVRVNTVNPGPVDTRMMRAIEVGLGSAGLSAAQRAAGIPLKRYGRPDEVAALVAFVSSDEAGFMTGSTVSLDGGLLAGRSR